MLVSPEGLQYVQAFGTHIWHIAEAPGRMTMLCGEMIIGSPVIDGQMLHNRVYCTTCLLAASEHLIGTSSNASNLKAELPQPPASTTSKKFDEDKLPWHLMPMEPLEEITKVLAFGAKKYGDRNWENPGLSWHRLYRAAFNHLKEWWLGRETDPETGLSHLAHAACNILFLLEYSRTHRELDDRPNSKKVR